ncbi:MAG TPA: FAD-dependent oxidoreductase [Trebonia sp.]|nr:FAD-dependent oxidoreductase [Trebonia sp.]
MAGPPIIEIRELGKPVRRVVLHHAIEVGRECDGENLSDDSVSRRHLRLVPTPVALSVVDLGSRNGTQVNGTPVTGRVVLEPGAVVRLGSTEIVMVGRQEMAAAPMAMRTMRPGQLPALVLPPPPPAPVAPPPAPSAVATLWARALGTGPRAGEPLFPAYTEMRRRIPVRAWHGVRIASVVAYLALCVTLFIRPAGGQFWFFKVIVPLLPILFFTAPGLWRNICPLAASNQAPRWLSFTRALTAPDWLRRYGALISIGLFFGITSARIAFFNSNGAGLSVLLLVTIISAFFAGIAFKGKSGWCSSTCPLLPLQRVYGQTPFVTVPNSHCQPCVGCTKNCYDFRPSVAYQADLHDPDPDWTAPRKLFVGALPGYVLGFFLLVSHPGLALPEVYLRLALFFLGSVGAFYALQALVPVDTTVAVAVWASAAINIFYWFSGVTLSGSFTTITGVRWPWLPWPIRVIVAVLSLFWIARTYVKGRQYEDDAASRPALPVIQISPRAAKVAQRAAESDGIEVGFAGSDKPARAEPGMSLLALAERERQPIEAGCRMGVCGADPVAVLAGGDCLTAPDEDEQNTLRRLGHADNTRMACVARLQSGPVRVSLTPEPGRPQAGKVAHFDRSIVSVAVIGNGIAGVTAADFIRRGHPDCEIHVVGSESHPLYNRMGISRLVYGRSAMQGLTLLPEQWYDEHQVVAWLNTVASRIDLASRRVFLATGDTIAYDRLILAMGSSSTQPPVGGFGRPGSFVLRSAGDALAIRAYVQQHGAREAVVAGGGLLGLEAAHSLHELGLRVTVLERGQRLLSRQIDEHCSELVHAHFARIGLQVLYRAESEALTGDDRVRGVSLKDGRTLRSDIFLAAVGIRPNVELARQAGIAVNRGVIVNDRMETSVPGVFAAGDVAEHGAQVFGLWPIAAKQGEAAAVNALGGNTSLVAEVPATILKGVGLDLFSIGQVAARPGDVVVVHEDPDPAAPSYRRLVISNGRAAGGIVLGTDPETMAAVTAAVKSRAAIPPPLVLELRRGHWGRLKDGGLVPALP